MNRPFKTWIVVAATLTAAVQPTFAGGRGMGGGHSSGGGVSRPAPRAPVAAPRLNSGNSLGQVQPHTRNSVAPNGNPSGALQRATPVVTPKNPAQNGTISRGQTPEATGKPIAGRNPITGPAPSRLDDIRRRINDGTLPGMAA